MTFENNIAHHLQNGRRVVGSFVLGHDPSVVRVAEAAGLDFLVLDFEHGTLSQGEAAQFINVACELSVSLFIRCTMEDIPFIGGLLDHGVDGVIVAGAHSEKEVRDVIDRVKFPPKGKRGLNPFVPAAEYGNLDSGTYMRRQNENTSVWILAENQFLLQELEPVCKLSGLTGVFLGPYDLSVDLGISGQVNHPRIVSIINEAVQTLIKYERSAGVFARDINAAQPWLDKGISFLAVGTDWSLLQDTWNSITQRCKV